MSGSAMGTTPRGGSRTMRGNTAAAGTAYTIGIDPYPGPKGKGSFLYGVDGQGNPNWLQPGYFTRVTMLRHLSGSTAHTLYFLRPLNWAVVSVAGAINSTSFTLATDPGKFSTAFHYPIGAPSSVTPNVNGAVYKTIANVADLTFTTTHYFAVQLADGTWFYDLCAGFNTSTLVVTTTTTIPNVTGGGIPKGAVMFLLGSTSTQDPNTGTLPPSLYPAVSVDTPYTDGGGDGIMASMHPGDPMMLYNANATAAGFTSGPTVSYTLY